jgi:hypothetical protein
MNAIRKLIRREPHPDLDKHDEILRDMQYVTEQLRTNIPIADMVRGTWQTKASYTKPEQRDANPDRKP